MLILQFQPQKKAKEGEEEGKRNQALFSNLTSRPDLSFNIGGITL